MAKRQPAQPLYNKLAFRGYHIEGQYTSPQLNHWTSFVDDYPSLEAYDRSFSSVGPGVFSPREIYQQQIEDGFYRNIVIRDNDGNILWDADREAEQLSTEILTDFNK